MSGALSEIKTAIAEMGGLGAYEIIDGTIESVNEEAYTVDINIDEGLTLPYIKLRSVSNGEKAGFVCVPAVGSEVVFAKVRGEQDYILLKVSELDKVIAEIETTSLTITKDGYEIKRGEETLQKILFDFVGELIKVIVVQGTSPNIPALKLIQKRIMQLLK